MIQDGILKLLEYFPRAKQWEKKQLAYNKRALSEFENTLDFLVLHYNATRRNDSDFWNYCRTMPVTAQLEENLGLFKEHGLITQNSAGLFNPASWLAVMIGQGHKPKHFDPKAQDISVDELRNEFFGFRQYLQQCVTPMPTHETAIAQLMNI